MPTKGIKNLASREVKLSFAGKTSGMTGSPQCVPALCLENILTVDAESRLWVWFFERTMVWNTALMP